MWALPVVLGYERCGWRTESKLWGRKSLKIQKQKEGDDKELPSKKWKQRKLAAEEKGP